MSDDEMKHFVKQAYMDVLKHRKRFIPLLLGGLVLLEIGLMISAFLDPRNFSWGEVLSPMNLLVFAPMWVILLFQLVLLVFRPDLVFAKKMSKHCPSLTAEAQLVYERCRVALRSPFKALAFPGGV